jgi:hypothetical protein
MAINKKLVIGLSICLVIAIFGFAFFKYFEKDKQPITIIQGTEGKDIIKNYPVSDRVYLDTARELTYIDTEKSYISAKPETLRRTGWVESEVIIKDYIGNIDAVFETDNENIIPTDLQVYDPSLIPYTFIQTCKDYVIKDNFVSCYAENGSLEFEDNFTSQKDNDFIIERFDLIEWKGIAIFTKVSTNLYVIKGLNLEKLKSYKYRYYIQVNGKVYAKYNLAFIPTEVNTKAYLTKYSPYILDPFINSSGDNQQKDYLNKSLIASYNLDQTAKPLIDGLRGKYNITVDVGSMNYGNNTALIEKSAYFYGDTGAGLFLNESVRNEIASANSDFSFLVWLYWIKGQGDSTSQRIIDDTSLQSNLACGTEKVDVYYFPANAITNTTVPQKIWTMLTYICVNGSVFKIYLNNTLVGLNDTGTCARWGTTLRIGTEATNNRNYGGNMDNLMIFNRSLNQTEIDDLYNNGLGIIWNTTAGESPVSISINVTLNLPTPYYNSSSQNITFNCSAYELNGVSMLNLTLIINNLDNYTIYNTTANQNLSIEVNRTLTDGVYNWTCRGSINTNNTTPAIRYFTVDTKPPQLNITYPRNTTYTDNFIPVNRKQITVNWTYSDLLPGTCIFYNNSANSTVNCNNLNYTLNITYGDTLFILWANDSLGQSNSTSISSSWIYKLFENSQTYNAVVFEGSSNDFTANVTTGGSYSISQADFIYNHTIYAGTITPSGSNYILSKTGVIAPSVTATANKTFIWQITLNDGSIFNLTSHNQTVIPVSIADCGTLTKMIYNFTILDERDQDLIYDGVVIETAANLYSYDQSTLIYSYSNTSVNSSLRLCITKEIGSSNYSLDVITRYTADTHANEYYNIVNATITNSTASQTIILYDLNNSQNTDFQLTFTGYDFLPVENALVYVNRQYIPENTFKTVELPKTDSNGQTILHLVRNERIYNFIIVKDGIVLVTFNNIMAFCEDYTIGNCKINLNAFTTGKEIFNYDKDIGLLHSGVTYINATKTVTFAFVTYDGTTKNVLMEVSRNDIFGNKTLCNDSLITSSGTLSCSLPSGIEDSLVIVKIYVAGKEVLTDYIQIAYEGFGKGGNFLFLIFILAFILMFGKSKNTFLIGIVLGFVTSIGLGLIKGKIIGYGSAGIWLIVIVIIALWKLNKNKEN